MTETPEPAETADVSDSDRKKKVVTRKQHDLITRVAVCGEDESFRGYYIQTWAMCGQLVKVVEKPYGKVQQLKYKMDAGKNSSVEGILEIYEISSWDKLIAHLNVLRVMDFVFLLFKYPISSGECKLIEF
ncbi:hypothetical protein RFI_04799 [Reticulomyxa filosa]|uniref:Uncharacterized protein n=1 Tax=Reticulomyxa filosa TaxID=46433 RepID=X6P275_RETFI|nr:hypothetical protein RFI_04799 [Reticulomyxa filosa]|eukprot:ETO32316.1 hypothetical protein RFI_04799 [Reticulomyxa filosa]